MLKLGAGGQKWLKGLHLCTAACWVGGGIALILLYFLKPGATDGRELYGMNRAIHHVDMAVVVVPGAFGCLLTGLAYSLFTGFGFFRHGWLIFKWIVTVTAIVFGTVCLGPWETAMMHISGELGMDALRDGAYLFNQKMNFIWGLVQVAVLVATVFVSVFKPWKNLRKKSE
jgi:uncharacterized membrane protein